MLLHIPHAKNSTEFPPKEFLTQNVSNAEAEKSWPRVVTVYEYKSEKQILPRKNIQTAF